MSRMGIRGLLLAVLPGLVCSCETPEGWQQFVQKGTLKKYVQAYPIDVTLITEKAGTAAKGTLEAVKQFLARTLHLEEVPIAYSSETAVEAEIKPQLRFRARQFTVADLPIQELTVQMPQVHLGIAKVFSEEGARLVRGAHFPVTIKLDDQGLATYIRKKQPQFSSFVLNLREGRVEVKMNYALLGVPMPIAVVGRLALVGETQIHLVDPQVRVNGQPLDPQIAEPIVAQFNPVFDAQRDLQLPVRVKLSAVTVKEKQVLLEGEAIWGTPAEKGAKGK